MAITSVDICNRALIQVGSQARISSLTQDSLEATILNSVYSATRDWCLGLTNWNFARKIAVLVQSKTVTVPPPNPWTTAQPGPPWKYEYTTPTDFVRALYLTNSDPNATNDSYAGAPRRAIVTSDSTGNKVVATNEASAVLVYTSNAIIEDKWPWYFERFTTSSLAEQIAPVMSPTMIEYLEKLSLQRLQIAEETNRREGLIIDDTTPEWLQAIGIPYPQRRDSTSRTTQPRSPSGDSNR